jgi:hypothetical protein
MGYAISGKIPANLIPSHAVQRFPSPLLPWILAPTPITRRMSGRPQLPEGWTAARALSLSLLVFARLPHDTRSQIQACIDAMTTAGQEDLAGSNDDDAEEEEQAAMTEEEISHIVEEKGSPWPIFIHSSADDR